MDAYICFIRLEGSRRWLTEAMRKQRGWWWWGGLRQLLPIHISSIKSVVLPNPTTKQGRCAHTHGREEKHMKHIKGFYRTYGTRRGIKTREQINPQSTVKLLIPCQCLFTYFAY